MSVPNVPVELVDGFNVIPQRALLILRDAFFSASMHFRLADSIACIHTTREKRSDRIGLLCKYEHTLTFAN